MEIHWIRKILAPWVRIQKLKFRIKLDWKSDQKSNKKQTKSHPHPNLRGCLGVRGSSKVWGRSTSVPYEVCRDKRLNKQDFSKYVIVFIFLGYSSRPLLQTKQYSERRKLDGISEGINLNNNL